MSTKTLVAKFPVRYTLDSSSSEAMKKLQGDALKKAIKKDLDIVASHRVKAGGSR
jgi:hypothetical protein